MNEESIFASAIEHQSSAERAAFLDGACGSDGELRARVEALINSHEQGGSFLNEPAAPASPTVERLIPESPGSQIGPYKLLQEIGQGGMGVVYMADQTAPVERRVALKIIKPGMDSRQIVARFEAERQALALMDHPNIAKVLDAATTESGHPYFVMELVNGVSITEYCDEQHLTVKERLELFLPVCHAVQHAHQKGIIHRDLKPSNVLVALYDHQAVPKVIDFGVAKAMSQKLTEKTLFTQFGEIVGTLEYMSPEQTRRNQLDVDTRSDVYALGVILYELLTGTTPFDKKRLRTAAFEEILRIFREEEPPQPSKRLSTIDTLRAIAGNRRVEPQKLTTMVCGELDWIVMKALEKDRMRRYETVNGFSSDIQRYLHDEPVVAGPPTARYRFRKFAKRNKKVLATASMIAAALLFGLIGTSSQWWRARLALQFAQTEAKRADEQRIRALDAEEVATQERDLARRQRDKNRRLLYVSDMVAAQEAWQSANLGRVMELLGRHVDANEQDLRRFAWYYLRRLCQRGLAAPGLDEHTSFVWSVAYSPDGKTLATASDDGTVKIWNVATRQALHTLTDHGATVLSVVYSADGKTLVSGGAHGTVRLWEPSSGALRQTIVAADGAVTGVAISPNGTLLVGSADGTLKLCDLPAGEPRTIFGRLGGPSIWSVALSRDGNKLAFGSANGTVRLRKVNGDGDWITLEGHTSWARSVAFSPDGKTLASASHDHTVKLWDTTKGEEKLTLEGHRQRVWDVAFSNDGKTLATASSTVKLWDVETGEEKDTLIGHEQAVYALAFSPDDKTLASGSHDTTVKLWDWAASTERNTLESHAGAVWDVAVSNDGGMLASASEDGTVKLWSVTTGDELKTLDAHSNWATCVAFSRNGETLASAGDDGTIKLWDVQAGKQLDVHIRGHAMPAPAVFDLAFSPDGETLASGGNDAKVRLWNVHTGEEIATFEEHSTIAWSVAFSPDGKTLASGSDDTTVKLRNLETGRELVTLKGHTSAVNSVAFSPQDDRILATGSADGSVRLWDITTGKELEELTGHTGLVWSVAFSPDGKMLASSSLDTTIRLWDLVTDGEPETLIGHSSEVKSLVFTPDGRTLISGSGDRKVKLWRRAHVEEVQATGW